MNAISDPGAIRRAYKAAALMNSPVPGERTAAFEAVARIFETYDVPWIEVLKAGLEAHTENRPQLPPRTPQSRFLADWKGTVRHLMNGMSALMSLWEIEFCTSIYRQKTLSEKQQKALVRIAERCYSGRPA